MYEARNRGLELVECVCCLWHSILGMISKLTVTYVMKQEYNGIQWNTMEYMDNFFLSFLFHSDLFLQGNMLALYPGIRTHPNVQLEQPEHEGDRYSGI